MYIHMHGHCSVAMDTMYRVRLATDGVREGGEYTEYRIQSGPRTLKRPADQSGGDSLVGSCTYGIIKTSSLVILHDLQSKPWTTT